MGQVSDVTLGADTQYSVGRLSEHEKGRMAVVSRKSYVLGMHDGLECIATTISEYALRIRVLGGWVYPNETKLVSASFPPHHHPQIQWLVDQVTTIPAVSVASSFCNCALMCWMRSLCCLNLRIQHLHSLWMRGSFGRLAAFSVFAGRQLIHLEGLNPALKGWRIQR